MAYQTGAATGLSYVANSTYGVVPTSPSMKTFRMSKMEAAFPLTKETFESEEINASQQTMGLYYGNRSGKCTLPVEFSYGAYDDFLEAVLGGTWASNVLKCGTTKRDFTFQDAATDVGVYEQNKGVIPTEFSLEIPASGVVTGTFGGVYKDKKTVQVAGASLAFDSTAKTITRLAGSWITDGFAVGDVVLVTGAADAGNNVSTFPITTLTATVITMSAATGMVTKTTATGATVALGSLGTPSAAATNDPFNTFTGSISEGGATLGHIIDLKFSATRNVGENHVLMDPTVQDVARGKIAVKGSFSVYFKDQALLQKFLNGTSSSLKAVLGNGTATSYEFNFGTVKYTANSRTRPELAMIENCEFTAIYDTTDASTLKITRIP